jgi:hypothetical protein
MSETEFDTPSERLVRGGALAALLFLALTLLALGFTLYRPSLAAAAPERTGELTLTTSADEASARSNP